MKDSALRAVSNALNETSIYFRDRENGSQRNYDREELLVKCWSAAAIPLRHFDSELARICESKAEYWVSPDSYSDDERENLGIRLDDVRKAYKAHLTPSFYSHRPRRN